MESQGQFTRSVFMVATRSSIRAPGRSCEPASISTSSPGSPLEARAPSSAVVGSSSPERASHTILAWPMAATPASSAAWASSARAASVRWAASAGTGAGGMTSQATPASVRAASCGCSGWSVSTRLAERSVSQARTVSSPGATRGLDVSTTIRAAGAPSKAAELARRGELPGGGLDRPTGGGQRVSHRDDGELAVVESTELRADLDVQVLGGQALVAPQLRLDLLLRRGGCLALGQLCGQRGLDRLVG